MDKEEDIIEVEEDLLGQSVGSMVEEKQQGGYSQDNYADQLMPRAVFQMEEHQNLTEEQRQAFSYIMAVRSQKEGLIRHKKKQFSRHLTEENEVQQIISAVPMQSAQDLIWQKLQQWRGQTLQNWKVVIANMKYCHKTKTPNKMFRKKMNISSLKVIPQINSLSLNRNLQLPQIQSLLTLFSNERIQKLEQKQIKHDDFYHLWIYSLLCLHQSYAQYQHFQDIASVNASIQRQCHFLNDISDRQGQNKVIFRELVIKWMTTVIILIQGFHQTFLKKYILIIKDIL